MSLTSSPSRFSPIEAQIAPLRILSHGRRQRRELARMARVDEPEFRSHPVDVMGVKRHKRGTSHGMAARNGTKNILVLGDVHVGSIYGLLPPDFVSSDGGEKPQNDGQKYLWLAGRT
jgi:hypothetical protein